MLFSHKLFIQPSDEQKEAFLIRIASDFEARNNLFELLYLLSEFQESPDSSNFISGLFGDWLHNHRNDINECRYDASSLVFHLARTKQLKETFEVFNDNSDFREDCELGEKEGEVGNE